jgi:hypothetical protein
MEFGRFGPGLILLGLLCLPTSSLEGQTATDRVAQLARSASETAELTETVGGGLRTGGEADLEVELVEGRRYMVAAFCDESCADIDLVLFDPDGAGVASDIFPTDEPVLNLTAATTGTYTVRVAMVECSEDDCAYSLGLFEGTFEEELALERVHMAGREMNVQDEMLAGGFSQLPFQEVDSLPQDYELRIPLPLRAGVDYQIVGICDDACSNLDLALFNPWGDLVDADDFMDAVPVLSVSTEEDAPFRLSVYMAGCEATSCGFKIVTFGKGDRIGPGGVIVPGDILLSDTTVAMLEEGDPTGPDGGFYDAYPMDIEPGQLLLVHLRSPDFPTRLTLEAPGGRRQQQDAYRDDRMNSHLGIMADEAGTYRVLVSSATPGSSGRYILRMAVASGRERTPAP